MLTNHLSFAFNLWTCKLCVCFVYFRDKDNCTLQIDGVHIPIGKCTTYIQSTPENAKEQQKTSYGLKLFVSFHCLSK